MDNLCHTLVGAALGEAGLKTRTRLAMPALLIGANIPDLDVLAYLAGPVEALGFRRGWTHGPLGLLLLPLLLTVVLLAYDRLARRTAPARGKEPPPAVGVLFLISLIGVLTHPVLDFLNTYGVRWLMPFDRAWYYGDTLFVVDPWVLGMLATGVAWSRRRARKADRRSKAPATVALLVVLAYVASMGTVTAVARGQVVQQLVAGGVAFSRVMVAPVPVNPVQREVLVETGDRYELGDYRWPSRTGFRGLREIVKNDSHPAARAAAGTAQGRVFLSWSRFPYFLIDESQGLVRIMDARYNRDWASVTVDMSGGGN